MIQAGFKGLITNDWDRENLEFLLNTKGDDFTAFWEQSDEDDRVYAQQLLDAYSRELKLKAELLEIEAQLDNFDEAKSLLGKVMSK
jgi:hypothetical protein